MNVNGEVLKNNKMYAFLMVLTMFATAGLQAWRTLFDNFAVQVIGLDGNHIGLIQSVREIPGFLALLVVFVLLVLKEHVVASLSVCILGLGVALAGYFPSYYGIIFTTLIMSFGFHYFETANQSLTLQYFDKKTAPLVLGKLRSIAAASNIGIGIIILVITPYLTYKSMFIGVGGVILLAGLWSLKKDPRSFDTVRQRSGFVLRKRYSLFYFLTFMAGARRQIFIAFAVFLLVKKFQFSVQEIALLFMVNNIINYFLSPYIGKCIVKYGERKVLSLEYISLVFIFIAYATVQSKWIIAGLYIADHIFFNFAIAIKTYFHKVANPKDIAPSMAVSFTINHIAAVILPVIGGLLWMVDYRIPFVGGAAMAFISLCAVQKIRT